MKHTKPIPKLDTWRAGTWWLDMKLPKDLRRCKVRRGVVTAIRWRGK